MSSIFRHLVFLGVHAAGISASTAAADHTDTSQARADLQPSDEEGGAQASLRNQTYDLVRAQLGPDRYAWTNLLVHRQQDLVTNVQMDGFMTKDLTVDVFKVDGVKRIRLFQIKEHASDSKIHQDLGILVASSYGCCDSTDAHAVYSLQNGKRLFFAGGDRDPYIFHVFWPNTDRARLVGVHVSGSERDAEIYKGRAKERSRRYMLVSLASRTEVFDQVEILFEDGDMSPPVAAIEWIPSAEMKVHDRQLAVWPSKGKQPSPVPLIQITLAAGPKILIPLDSDRFGEISAPKGVTSIRLPLVK
jgi:hypothetical protein